MFTAFSSFGNLRLAIAGTGQSRRRQYRNGVRSAVPDGMTRLGLQTMGTARLRRRQAVHGIGDNSTNVPPHACGAQECRSFDVSPGLRSKDRHVVHPCFRRSTPVCRCPRFPISPYPPFETESRFRIRFRLKLQRWPISGTTSHSVAVISGRAAIVYFPAEDRTGDILPDRRWFRSFGELKEKSARIVGCFEGHDAHMRCRCTIRVEYDS